MKLINRPLYTPDNYPKYVVSLDEFNRGGDVQGIQHLHLSDFLKKEVL